MASAAPSAAVAADLILKTLKLAGYSYISFKISILM
jgi:hypothetical protein